MRDGMITREQAEEALSDLNPVFHAAVAEAWRQWAQGHAPLYPRPRIRTIAACMNQTVEDQLRMRLGAVPGIVIPDPDKDRFWVHATGPNILVFVKKFNDDFSISNYPTQRARRFNGQQAVFDIPAAPRVTLGYVLKATRDAIVGTYVAFLKNNVLQWKYELALGPDGVPAIVPDTPNLPLTGAPAVTLKGATRKKKNSDEGNEE